MTAVATTSAVRIRDLEFRYRRSESPVLSLETLDIAVGERVFLHGPSGCGKSTLLALLAGVQVPQRGQLAVLGTDLPGLSAGARDRFRADHIGFVFQLFNLLPYLDVRDNVLLPCGFSALRARRARSVDGDLRRHAQRLLDALRLPLDLLGRPVTALSVGQQQRVAVARALAGGPELLICDEPTSALDADSRAAFIELLFAQCAASGCTLLLVSHDRGLAQGFDRVLDLPGLQRAPMRAASP